MFPHLKGSAVYVILFTFNLHCYNSLWWGECVHFCKFGKCIESLMCHNQDTEQLPHHWKLPHAIPLQSAPHLPLTPGNHFLFSVSVVLSFPECPIPDITQYLTFETARKITWVVACISNSLLSIAELHHDLFMSSPAEEQLGYFQFLTTMRNAAISKHLCTGFYVKIIFLQQQVCQSHINEYGLTL